MQKGKKTQECDKMKCSKCVHAYKDYPYDEKSGKFLYCALHSFGMIEQDFFCKSFSLDETRREYV